MIAKTRVSLIFLALNLLMSPAYGRDNCDAVLNSAESSARYYSVNSTITSAESRPAISEMIKTLLKIENLALKNSTTVSQIYNRVLPAIRETLAFAQRLEKEDQPDQKHVFKLAHQFSKIVDIPTYFTNEVGYYADGFDTVSRFNNKEYQVRADEFTHRRLDGALEKFRDDWGKWQNKIILKPALKDLTHVFYIGDVPYEFQKDQNYFFQYRYVARVGLLTLRELFQDRESGKVFYGVSKKPFAPFDGSHSGAEGFAEHDIFHAFVTKFFDAQIFAKLNVTTSAEATRVKKITHRLLTERLAEWDQIPDAGFRAAIEVMYFLILHEQGQSYPIGVNELLAEKKRRKFYVESANEGIAESYFGEEYIGKLKGREIELLKKAMTWITTRAKADEKQFFKEFNK